MTTATVETLLVEIFETKTRIIQQVKHQTELYNRHLASKALLHGVTPPSWLWNPTNSISQELSKDELISELLPPGPSLRPPVRDSVAGTSHYSKPFITYYREVADGFGVEAYAFHKNGHDAVEGQSTIVEGDECIAQYSSNYLPELDVSSPADFEDVRVTELYTAPDQSLARIQRSKSRQRSIEQRNSATSQAKRNSGNEHTSRASSSDNRLFALNFEQVDHIDDSDIFSEPCAASVAEQSAFHLRNENNTFACSNETNLTALEPEQIYCVNEPPRSAEPLSISSEGCRVEGKSETDNENSGDGYNDHDVPVAMYKSSANSHSLEKQTVRNSEVEDKDSNTFNKGSVTSRDIVKIDGDIGSTTGYGRSNERGAIVHPESSTRSTSSGKSCENTASKKEKSCIEEKISDVYVKKSSTPKRPAQHENHLSDFMEENYFSECEAGNNALRMDPEVSNNQICSFDGLLEQTCFENGSGNWILPPNACQEVSDIRESDLEDGQPQNDNDPNVLRIATLNKASLPDKNFSIQMMDAYANEELCCESAQRLDENQSLVAVRETDRSDHKRSEDSPLIWQTLKAPSNFGSGGCSFAQFQGCARGKSIYEDKLFQRASGDHVMLPDMCDKAEQLEYIYKIEAIDPGTVKLAETFHVSVKAEDTEKSLGNSCSPFADAAAGVFRDSFMTNNAGSSGVQMTKSEPRRSWHYELEAGQNNGQHSPSNKAASTQSKFSNTIDVVKFTYEHEGEFSSELLVEEEKCVCTNYENIGNYSQNNSEAAGSRWTEEAVESTLDGLFPSTNPPCLSSVYAKNHEDEQRSEIKRDDYPQGIEKLSSSEGSSEGRISVQVVGHQPQHLDHSLRNKDLELLINDYRNLPESISEEGHSKGKFVVEEDSVSSHPVQAHHIEELSAIDVDQSQPELELLIVDSQSESASAYTPLPHFLSTFKMDKVPDLFHSVPNGVLEHTELGGVHFLDDVKEFQASLNTFGEAEGGLQGVPSTNNLSCSGAPMGVPTVNGFSSPEGRFWEGCSSQSSSSGKLLSSNPEFECFTIYESAEDDSEELSNDVDSLTVNCHAIDSNKFLEDEDSSTVHCTAREPSTGTHNKLKKFLRSSHKKKGTGKDTQTPLLVANGKRMAKESLNNRYKKVKTSGKSGLKNEHLDRPREPFSSNIVSNMTSFIPLIQQKQAAAKACPGKREIKVKALEAAEAAKRLEEKRENQRKLKKEALKVERARVMEQEKAKQFKLFKQKKEDEQRRKDADILLRKRSREEEERKRTRTEDARQKQRDQEEKLHAKKAGNIDMKKRSNHELKLPQMKKPGGDHVKLDNESSSTAISSIDIQQASSKEGSYSADLCDNMQENCTPVTVKPNYFVSDNIQEKSYEISPYQGSDDEDDELHTKKTKKFIPSWASKNLVAESLSLMQEVDPRVIFPLESRCSIGEVLLPRKLQQVK